jgi:amino acid transporter
MLSFILYVIGFFVLLAGVGYGAYLLDVPTTWIVVGALVIVGAGIMSSGSHMKRHFYPGDASDA